MVAPENPHILAQGAINHPNSFFLHAAENRAIHELIEQQQRLAYGKDSFIEFYGL